LARELGELSKQIEYGEFVNIVIPSITQLSNDNETVIRQALVEQLPEFANCCIKVQVYFRVNNEKQEVERHKI
jgi:hypothetical protein